MSRRPDLPTICSLDSSVVPGLVSRRHCQLIGEVVPASHFFSSIFAVDFYEQRRLGRGDICITFHHSLIEFEVLNHNVTSSCSRGLKHSESGSSAVGSDFVCASLTFEQARKGDGSLITLSIEHEVGSISANVVVVGAHGCEGVLRLVELVRA